MWQIRRGLLLILRSHSANLLLSTTLILSLKLRFLSLVLLKKKRRRWMRLFLFFSLTQIFLPAVLFLSPSMLSEKLKTPPAMSFLQDGLQQRGGRGRRRHLACEFSMIQCSSGYGEKEKKIYVWERGAKTFLLFRNVIVENTAKSFSAMEWILRTRWAHSRPGP